MNLTEYTGWVGVQSLITYLVRQLLQPATKGSLDTWPRPLPSDKMSLQTTSETLRSSSSANRSHCYYQLQGDRPIIQVKHSPNINRTKRQNKQYFQEHTMSSQSESFKLQDSIEPKNTQLQRFLTRIDQPTFKAMMSYVETHTPTNPNMTTMPRITLYQDMLIAVTFKSHEQQIAEDKSVVRSLCLQLELKTKRKAITIKERISKKLAKLDAAEILDHLRRNVDFTFDQSRKLKSKTGRSKLEGDISVSNDDTPPGREVKLQPSTEESKQSSSEVLFGTTRRQPIGISRQVPLVMNNKQALAKPLQTMSGDKHIKLRIDQQSGRIIIYNPEQIQSVIQANQNVKTSELPKTVKSQEPIITKGSSNIEPNSNQSITNTVPNSQLAVGTANESNTNDEVITVMSDSDTPKMTLKQKAQQVFSLLRQVPIENFNDPILKDINEWQNRFMDALNTTQKDTSGAKLPNGQSTVLAEEVKPSLPEFSGIQEDFQLYQSDPAKQKHLRWSKEQDNLLQDYISNKLQFENEFKCMQRYKSAVQIKNRCDFLTLSSQIACESMLNE